MDRPWLPALTLTLVFAAGLAATPPAVAQPTPHPSAYASMTRVDAHIAQLRTRLGITAAEMPQWHALAAVMRANASSMERLYQERTARVARMNAVQVMESYRSFARLHVVALDRLVPAFRRLYAVLTPAQRRTADDLFQDRIQAAEKGKSK